jgi:RNA polymerase sigma-70 factor (ECF subfamily)
LSRPSRPQITEWLASWSNGNDLALEKLVPLVYDELHRLAQVYMCRERPGHPLQATALVNEAYLRLVDSDGIRWQNRAHFYAVAAKLMRNILVDFARSRNELKRGGGAVHVSFDDTLTVSEERSAEIVELDHALNKLAKLNERHSRIVELRFFVGMTEPEIAEILHVSPRTVSSDWSLARAWLIRELEKSRPDDP